MPRCLYNSSISAFIISDAKFLLGSFGISYHGDILTTTNEAWAEEIDIMQDVLQPWKDEPGHIIFEYDIPRMGMVICVPTGNSKKTVGGFPEDATRLPEFNNGTYEYLKSLGLEEL